MPTIAAGGSLTLASTGTDSPGASTSIDIITSGSAFIDQQFSSPGPPGYIITMPNGWTLTYDSASPPNFTITAPSGASTQTGVEVRAICSIAGSVTARSAFFSIGTISPSLTRVRRSRSQVY